MTSSILLPRKLKSGLDLKIDFVSSFGEPSRQMRLEKVMYSALNIVVKRIRESRVIVFSVREPDFSMVLAGVGNPFFLLFQKKMRGASPLHSRRGFLCPKKHAQGFFFAAKIVFF